MNRKIIAAAVAALCALGVHAQGTPFNGVVTDLSGKGISGVKISLVKRSEKYTFSNKKGQFGLTDVPADDTLRLVWKKKEQIIPVENRKSLRIIWADGSTLSAKEDQELVDCGYGFVKRREATHSTSGISGEELRRTGATNLWDALQGRIAGLNVTTSSIPGEEAEVVIRGQNSILGSTTPLFVVDGVIVESLDYVSLDEVEYVEVMKEAGIYGSRGANGAILVRTRNAPK